jgi:hypothetical protein
MNRDDIIRMAREQGNLPETAVDSVRVNSDDLGQFAALAAAEREECAKVSDAEVIAMGNGNREGLVAGLSAAAIRARGKE